MVENSFPTCQKKPTTNVKRFRKCHGFLFSVLREAGLYISCVENA
jgi:hypothetical protein